MVILLIWLSYNFWICIPNIVVNETVVIAQLEPVGAGNNCWQYFFKYPFSVVRISRIINFI